MTHSIGTFLSQRPWIPDIHLRTSRSEISTDLPPSDVMPFENVHITCTTVYASLIMGPQEEHNSPPS
jgi:hypothetical protein